MNDTLNASRFIGVVATNSPAYVETVLRLMQTGLCVVPLRSSDDTERLSTARASDVVGVEPGHGWFRPTFAPNSDDKPALVSFTSGTEGRAKGVVLTHEALADVVTRLNDVMAVDASIREYVGVPVYYSFGFGRCRAVAAAGGEAYIPEHGFDPVELASMLERGEVNAVSAVPSLWRTVLDATDLFANVGERVKWIEIGSQYMSREEKEALKRLFPAAKIVQHYGLTEASRSTFLLVSEATDDALDSVGKALGRVEVRINNEGRICLRGPHVAHTLLLGGEQRPARDADGWLVTGDLGALRDGYLHYHGRADDIINCGGLKLSPEALELAIRTRTGITGDFAIGRMPDKVRGDGILLACAPALSARHEELFEALVAEAATLGIHARSAIKTVEIDALPKTATGKVQRNQLHELPSRNLRAAEAGAAATVSATATEQLTERERALVEIWREALGVNDLRLDDSFYELGGDSVTALSVVVRMSRAGLDMAVCRRIFQGATIRELARTSEGGKPAAGADEAATAGRQEYLSTLMVNVVRGVLVASVVLGHWSPGALARLPAAEALAPFFAAFFSFGTPGFAIAFGVGFGYLYLEKFREAPGRLTNVVKLGTSVVGAGVVLLAGLRIGMMETAIRYESFFTFFYSALTFYLLALPTMPLWFRAITSIPRPWRVVAILAFAATSHVLGHVMVAIIGTEQPDGFLRLARLMLVAKYNYFTMMGGVLAGVALGAFVRMKGDEGAANRQLALAGISAIAGAVTTAFALGQADYLARWPSPLTSWKWIFYLGIVALLLSGLLSLRARYADLPRNARRLLEAFATVGQLALPFFVFHEAIVPLTSVLRRVGVAGEAATAVALGVFVFGSWLMVSRVYSFFHSE